MASGETTGLMESDKKKWKIRCNSLSLHRLIGYIVFITSMFLSTAASACAQALGGYVPGNQRNVWRYLAQLLCVAPIVSIKKLDVRISGKRTLLSMTSVCVMFPAINWAYYGADAYIPTSSVGCVHITMLILVSTVISVVLFKDFERYMLAAVFLCIIGVTLVCQPKFVFIGSRPLIIHPLCGFHEQVGLRNHSLNESIVHDNSSFEMFSPGYTSNATKGMINGRLGQAEIGYSYTVLSGTLYALMCCCVSKGLTDVHPFVTTFWLAVTGILLSVIGMAVFETPMLPSSDICLGLLMAHAASAGSCAVFLIWGMSLLPPRVCAIITSFEVVLMCTAQYTMLRDINKGHGNAAEVIGVVVVVIGIMVRPIRQIFAAMNQNESDEEHIQKDGN